MLNLANGVEDSIPVLSPGVATAGRGSEVLIELALLGVALGIWLLISWRWREGTWKWKVKWFFPDEVGRRFLHWKALMAAAAFYATASLALFVLVAQVFHATFAIGSTAGFLAVVAGLTLGAASVLNTIALLNREQRYVIDFRGFYQGMTEIMRKVRERHPLPRRALISGERVHFLDYTPLVGEVSDPDVAEDVYGVLRSMVANSHESHLVFLSSKEGDLEAFYRRLLAPKEATDFDAIVEQRVKNADQRIAELDKGQVAVWRSRIVHTEHALTTNDMAIDYFVTQKKNTASNELCGRLTENLKEVEYLRDVVRDYIREAVTPKLKWDSDDLGLSFGVGQENIATIDVFSSSDITHINLDAIEGKASHNPIEVSGELTAGNYYKFKPDKNVRWVRVRLSKKAEWPDMKLLERGTGGHSGVRKDDPKPRRSEFSYVVRVPQKPGGSP